MKTKEKRILIDRVFSFRREPQFRADHGGDTEFANDDAFEKTERDASVTAVANGTHHAKCSAGLTGEVAYESDAWQELGGEA